MITNRSRENIERAIQLLLVFKRPVPSAPTTACFFNRASSPSLLTRAAAFLAYLDEADAEGEFDGRPQNGAAPILPPNVRVAKDSCT